MSFQSPLRNFLLLFIFFYTFQRNISLIYIFNFKKSIFLKIPKLLFASGIIISFHINKAFCLYFQSGYFITFANNPFFLFEKYVIQFFHHSFIDNCLIIFKYKKRKKSMLFYKIIYMFELYIFKCSVKYSFCLKRLYLFIYNFQKEQKLF